MCKKTKGFSYIEVILAMALFAIAMLAVIPTLSQAGRNLVFAEGAYESHLQAQRMMITVRDALLAGADPEAVATLYAAGSFEFSVWIFGRGEMEFHSINHPDADVSFTGVNLAMPSQGSTVIAIVWGNEGQLAGRAIGMVYL